ncbi:MAG TPA: phosphoenolpyruvate carboxykinase domain-containing protein, partial [Bacillota bacterium]
VFERVSGQGKAVETPIGYMPSMDAIDRGGLNVSDAEMAELLKVDRDEWLKEAASIREYYTKFGDKLPQELRKEIDALEERLRDAK